MAVRFDRSKLKPLPKLKNSLSVRFCAIDLQISFLALVIASKKSKTINETCAKWSQFGAVSETQGLASNYDTTLKYDGIRKIRMTYNHLFIFACVYFSTLTGLRALFLLSFMYYFKQIQNPKLIVAFNTKCKLNNYKYDIG